MAAKLYSDPIRPVPTYVGHAAKQTCTKFHQDSFKAERLVCIEQTDGHGYPLQGWTQCGDFQVRGWVSDKSSVLAAVCMNLRVLVLTYILIEYTVDIFRSAAVLQASSQLWRPRS